MDNNLIRLLLEKQKLLSRLYPSPEIMRTWQIAKQAALPPLLRDNDLNATVQKSLFAVKQASMSNNYLQVFRQIETIGELVALKTSLLYREYDFTKIADFITDFVEEEEKSQSGLIIVIDEARRIKEIITNIYNDNDLLLKIDPRDFEKLVGEILRSQGFEVELTQQTRDNGYDLLAIKHIDKHDPLKFLVECKRYTKQKVGVEVIRQFKEVIQTENANRGIIVTTSYFTLDAKKKQKEIPYLLDFRDKDKLMEWVNDYVRLMP